VRVPWPRRTAAPDPRLRLEHRAALHELAANLAEARAAATGAAGDTADRAGQLSLLCDRTIQAATVLQMLPPPLATATGPLDRQLTRLLRRAMAARSRAATGEIATPVLEELLADSSVLAATAATASQLADDFTGSALHRVDLRDLHLAGVRWDRSTRWPRHWRTRITDTSRALDDGTFEIQQAQR
jgi:hypothetical protein